MDKKSLFLAFLSRFELNSKKLDSIISEMDEISIDSFFKLDLKKFLSSDIINQINLHSSEREIAAYLNNLKNSNIGIMTRYDDDFPERLQGVDDAPYYLFYKGDKSLLSQKAVAIVGTRSPSNYGRIVTDRFAEGLAKAGLVIVSGLAYGVDSIAHRKTLAVGGKTIAVLGSGFNNIYPAEHTSLAREIEEKGLLISEYNPSVKPTRYTFPLRNRIVAGLADGVLITEAGGKSGTLHTKDFALDYGKSVYAVPGNVTSEKSALPNELIKTGQGQCVISANDILMDLGVSPTKERTAVQLGLIEQKIVDSLASGEKDVDFLTQTCQLDVKSLSSYLTTMEISGLIRRMPGGFYALA